MGDVSDDLREFMKTEYDGRLSVVTEDRIHREGLVHYAVQFTGGQLSSADGVGFILSSKLPCPKNIQKIVSIFVNRSGRICVRAHSQVCRCDANVKQIHVGDWISFAVDIDKQTAEITVWPARGGQVASVNLNFGAVLDMVRITMPALPNVKCGYFACVVKNAGVSLRLGS